MKVEHRCAGGRRRRADRMGSGKLKEQDALRFETGMDAPQSGKAAQHESGAGKKNKGESHFDDNQNALGAVVAASYAAAGLLESIIQIRAGTAQSGDQTKENSNEYGEPNREKKNRQVQTNLLRARKGLRQGGQTSAGTPGGEK